MELIYATTPFVSYRGSDDVRLKEPCLQTFSRQWPKPRGPTSVNGNASELWGWASGSINLTIASRASAMFLDSPGGSISTVTLSSSWSCLGKGPSLLGCFSLVRPYKISIKCEGIQIGVNYWQRILLESLSAKRRESLYMQGGSHYFRDITSRSPLWGRYIPQQDPKQLLSIEIQTTWHSKSHIHEPLIANNLGPVRCLCHCKLLESWV